MIRDLNKKYYADNKEDLLERSKLYYLNHKEEKKEYDKQYREDNRIERNEKKKLDYQKNKEKVALFKSERIVCNCGTEISRGSMASHKKTQRHIKKLES
jgi:hypothetical protein